MVFVAGFVRRKNTFGDDAHYFSAQYGQGNKP